MLPHCEGKRGQGFLSLTGNVAWLKLHCETWAPWKEQAVWLGPHPQTRNTDHREKGSGILILHMELNFISPSLPLTLQFTELNFEFYEGQDHCICNHTCPAHQ